MSSEGIASAIRYLAEAIRGLATEISRSRQASSSAEVPEEELGEWEVIEEQSSVPGAPLDFNATIRFEAETGCCSFLRRFLVQDWLALQR